MNNQSPEVFFITLAILGGLYFLFGYLINFKYLVSGAVSYPIYRTMIMLYEEYSFMLNSTNQDKLIFSGAVLATGVVTLLTVTYFFLNPLVPWYRSSVYAAKSRRIWNPLVLCSIWVFEAVLVHYLRYTPLLEDKGFSTYQQDHLLAYYMAGIGVLLVLSAMFHSKGLLGTIEKSFLVGIAKISAWFKSKKRVFVDDSRDTSPRSSKRKAPPMVPTVKETTNLDTGQNRTEPLEIEQNNLVDIRDGNYHYKKVKVISRGGFGVVYLVKNMKSNVFYAAKCPHLPFSSDDERKRFQIEVDSQSSIRHQNVVRVLHTCHQDDFVYIIMEYIEGGDLRKSMFEKKYVDLPSKFNLMYQILNGLNYIHSNKIIHRDIKPNNILISRDGIAKITDFGIAKDLNATQITVTGSVMGTMEYMSPEQHRGMKVDLRTDIYSVGLTFYQLLSGNKLYPEGVSSNDFYDFKKNHSFTPLYKIDDKISVKLSESIHKAFNFDRENRYESVTAFRKAIANSI